MVKGILRWFFTQILLPLGVIFIPPFMLIQLGVVKDLNFDALLISIFLFDVFLFISVYSRLERIIKEIRGIIPSRLRKFLEFIKIIREFIIFTYWCPLLIYGIFYTIKELENLEKFKLLLQPLPCKEIFYYTAGISLFLVVFFISTLFSASLVRQRIIQEDKVY